MNKTVIISASFIAAIALFSGLVLPKYESLKLKISERAIKESNLNNKNDYYEKVLAISNELEEYPEEMAKIDFALPQKISLPAMYGFFQKKASESGLVLKDEKINFGAAQKENSAIKEYISTLQLAGSYPAFKNFLSVLEKSAKIIEVEKISFSSSEKSESAFSFDVSAKFYSY